MLLQLRPSHVKRDKEKAKGPKQCHQHQGLLSPATSLPHLSNAPQNIYIKMIPILGKKRKNKQFYLFTAIVQLVNSILPNILLINLSS
jgi:hypothetical protein